jgi:nucleoid DNA-binding protein
MVINKTNLIHVLKKSSELSYREAAFCVGFLFEVIADGISRGERVELRGLGSFAVKNVAAKKTSFASVPAHGRIVFRPCEKLRRAVWDRGSK